MMDINTHYYIGEFKRAPLKMHHFRRVGSGLVCRSPARKVLRVSLAYDNSAEEAICPKLRWHSDHSHEELPPRFLPSPVAPRSVRRKGALHLKGPFHLWPWVVAQGFPPCPLLPALRRFWRLSHKLGL